MADDAIADRREFGAARDRGRIKGAALRRSHGIDGRLVGQDRETGSAGEGEDQHSTDDVAQPHGPLPFAGIPGRYDPRAQPAERYR